jgi:hypothetical protein
MSSEFKNISFQSELEDFNVYGLKYEEESGQNHQNACVEENAAYVITIYIRLKNKCTFNRKIYSLVCQN